jgi:hypothetical protein
MIKLLLGNGIRIEELDDEKKTAFELALGADQIRILHLLTKNVSLEQTPQLFH